MELVYLWVEEYKNIKNQGFRFSPRFECEFDGENLTITEDKDYVSIFPDNINITAIVGENGSGKSSVLAGIKNAFSIYKINGEYYSKGFNIKNIKAPFTVKENTIEILEHTIYLDFDLIKINPIKDFWSYIYQNIYQRNLYHFVESNLNTNSSFNIEQFRKNFFNLIIKHYNKFKSSIFTYNPNKIIFSDYIQSKKEEKELNNIIQETQEKHLTKEKFLVFLLINISKLNNLKIPSIKNMNDLKENENFIIDNAKYLFDIKHDEKDYKEKLNLEIDAINSFFENMKQFQDKTIISINEFEKIFNQHEKAFLRLINIGFISIDLLDFKERRFFDLSYGERKFFTENLMVYDDIKRKNKNDILIVLDEPDLTLHPNWQKRYINEMVNLLSNFPEKKFHIVITSHSPFILSDIPKENVIFLEKYIKDEDKEQKEGNCKNVTKNMELKTFGANIHTLLSDGFFMSDGLMGEFAKNKIEEIKKFYDENKELKKDDSDFESKKEEFETKKKDFYNIQSIIGEKFLQTIIKNYLDELEIIFNGKKEFLDKEIKRLQALQESLND
ncbi:ATP-binding protein [Aliarcobacter butzleri]|uniref:ATP-binding protein n=1 Tax=Aliarcobacter butzleri TaxID=28197 RepID=UPI0021B21417|nr:ATP-binding protein [Aliarcobacter butzleri]MCT7649040.1 ATP-binding protein [Aliarcobacter butzleri]